MHWNFKTSEIYEFFPDADEMITMALCNENGNNAITEDEDAGDDDDDEL